MMNLTEKGDPASMKKRFATPYHVQCSIVFTAQGTLMPERRPVYLSGVNFIVRGFTKIPEVLIA